MAKEFLLPDIGEGLTEAEIIRWLVGEGDPVDVDQSIVEIETDKALMEIPTPWAGVVVAHGAPEGTVLEVGAVLATIQTVDESPADALSRESAPIVGTLSDQAVDLPPRQTASSATSEPTPIEALPVVRRLAKDLDVDLASVTGTGAEGRITRDDVRRAAEDTSPADAAEDDTAGAEQSASVGEERPPQREAGTSDRGEVVHLSKLRRTIGERVSASWREIPHVTAFDSADVTRLFASREALKRRRNAPVSMDAMIVKAVVTALGQHREMAARLDGETLTYPERIHIGVAVDTDDGLMVVVVEDPGKHDLVALSAEITRLSRLARSRQLPAQALGGQAFTVSNVGAVGGGYGTPIVPHGTTGILSVGKAEHTPVARGGRLEIAPMMPLSLSYDHRVIDGSGGRRFLATVVENLEEPTLFLA